MMKRAWQFSILAKAMFVSLVLAISGAAAAPSPPPAKPDGQHDFDFALGTWKSHVRRLQKPLTGSTSWIDGDATVSVGKIWNGRGNLEEIDLVTPSGRLQGLTLRLYDAPARQWRVHWAKASDGVLTSPPSIGQFKDGRGELYDQETLNGKVILVRYIFSDVTPTSYHFEQAFSADRGHTWEANWVADLSRTSADPVAPTLSAEDRNRDFDFNLGEWDVAVKRLTDPLSGKSNWTNWKGTGHIAPVWNGLANIAEFDLDGPTGHLQGVGLRIYNAEAKQWSISWANGRDGVIGVPVVGVFKDGRGELLDVEDFKGRQIFVRNLFTNITPDSAEFEQAFSEDGKSWEPNWLMTFKRKTIETKQ